MGSGEVGDVVVGVAVSTDATLVRATAVLLSRARPKRRGDAGNRRVGRGNAVFADQGDYRILGFTLIHRLPPHPDGVAVTDVIRVEFEVVGAVQGGERHCETPLAATLDRSVGEADSGSVNRPSVARRSVPASGRSGRMRP